MKRWLFIGLMLVPVAGSPAESVAVRTCKAYVQGRIDRLDAHLHKGDPTGNARKLVARRDRLREQYRRCERNPQAWKKEV